MKSNVLPYVLLAIMCLVVIAQSDLIRRANRTMEEQSSVMQKLDAADAQLQEADRKLKLICLRGGRDV